MPITSYNILCKLKITNTTLTLKINLEKPIGYHQMLSRKTKTKTEKEAEYGRKWRLKNKEKIKKYRLKNAKRIKLNQKKWKKINPDYQKKWRLKNIEKVRKNDRENKQKLRKDPKYRQKENAGNKKWRAKAMKNPKYRNKLNRRNRQWQRNNPDKVKEMRAKYYREVTKSRLKNDTKFLEKRIASEILYAQKRPKIKRKAIKKAKIQAISLCHPQGKIECIKKNCKENDLDKLVLDHTRGREIMGHDKKIGGFRLYNWIIKYYDENGKPPGDLKPMCQNCNWEKEQARKVRYYRKKLVSQIPVRRR